MKHLSDFDERSWHSEDGGKVIYCLTFSKISIMLLDGQGVHNLHRFLPQTHSV